MFSLVDDELGCTDVVKHYIDMGDHHPIWQYPIDAQCTETAEMIADMEKKEPSASSWANPNVLEKDETARFCMDCRHVIAVMLFS